MSGDIARRVALAAWCAALAALAALGLATPAAAEPEPPRPDARAWLLIDSDDGEVLAARRRSRPAPIASTTKLMTAYVARQELGLDQRVVAPGYNGDPVESLLGLEEGERIRVRDLLAGLLLASGNDAAVALAVASSGSVPDFVDEMNAAARRLGLSDTSFANPIGLDDPGNRSTPDDLARLAIELRRDPFIARLVDTPRMRLLSGARRREIVNRNQLVASVDWVDGVKTGHTLGAGHVLIGSGTRKGVTLVSVVLGAPSEQARNRATLELLRYGFSLYQRRSAVEHSERLESAAIRYRDERLPLLAARDIDLVVREGQRVRTRVIAPDEVEGPIAKGDRIGRAVVTVDGEFAGRAPLVAARAVSEATTLERIDDAVPGPGGVTLGLGVGACVLAIAGILVARRWSRAGG